MTRRLLPIGLGLMLVVGACQRTEPKEVVLLVGRDLNPSWASVYEPDLGAQGRELTVVNLGDGSVADALKAYVRPQGPKVIAVPMALSAGDPVARELTAFAQSAKGVTTVDTPEGHNQIAAMLAQRALKLSKNRSQEGLFFVMELPPGADPAAVRATADKVEAGIRASVDFGRVAGVIWTGPESVTELKAKMIGILKPIVVTYALNPGPLAQSIRTHVKGVRYGFDAESVLSDGYYRGWLRGQVGQASVSATTP